MSDLARLLAALEFSADKHRFQRRKDRAASPYINHPIEVASLLANVGGVTDVEILIAGVLHDTIEDTATTGAELEAQFGPTVRRLVEEVTDDKSLPKAERKRLQIEHAPHISPGAQAVKIADKIANVGDLTHHPPTDWTLERRREYFDWTERVVAGCGDSHPLLVAYFRQRLAEARRALAADN